ncbi:MAG: YqaJ viral recombinase family protein [Bacteroidaceae bacterium]
MSEWLQNRSGYITASNLHLLMTKGRGKEQAWGDSAISYLYKVEYERFMGCPGIETDAAPLRFGRENEPYAIEWLRRNFNPYVRYYEVDFPEKPFIKVDFAKFGSTPDADIVGFNGTVEELIEIKTTFSEKATYTYFSPSKPYDKKRAMALEEHIDQLIGQLLCFPNVNVIHLLKYNPQRDSEYDIKPIDDPSRGIMFTFTREELGLAIDIRRERIIMADEYLETGFELEGINDYYRIRNEKKYN